MPQEKVDRYEVHELAHEMFLSLDKITSIKKGTVLAIRCTIKQVDMLFLCGALVA